MFSPPLLLPSGDEKRVGGNDSDDDSVEENMPDSDFLIFLRSLSPAHLGWKIYIHDVTVLFQASFKGAQRSEYI